MSSLHRSNLWLPEQSIAWDRRDTLIVVLLVLLAAVLRLWMFGNLGLNHFDEGAYAMSSLAIFDGAVPQQLYPLQHYLSPPLFCSLSGLVMLALGTSSDLVPLGLSATFGVLTIALVYLIGRDWLGRTAAVSSAVLIALSDYHIMYSRTGLVDATFAFFFLLALWLYALAERRESLGVAVLAGVATGLAWNTKYHGWLAGVVAAAALLPYLVIGERRRLTGGALRIGCAAVFAGLLFIPWFLFVEAQEGGYSRLLAEHVRHLRPGHFLDHILVHLRTQLYLDGWMGRFAPLLALSCAVLTTAREARSGCATILLWGASILLAGLLLGESVVVALLALVGIAVLLSERSHSRWVLLAFFLVFLVLTPLYVPYTRLLLPWLCSVYLLAGVGLQALARQGRDPVSGLYPLRRRVAVGGALAVAGVVALAIFGSREATETYRSNTGFRRAATEVASVLPEHGPVIVLGEPAVVFYLRKLGFPALHIDRPQQLYDHFEPGESFHLIGGIYSRRTRGWEKWMRRHAGAAREVARVAVDVNDVRLLDDFRPRRARQYRRSPGGDYDLLIFRATLPGF